MRVRTRPPTHPGAIIKRQHLEPMQITISDLALRLGLSRQIVDNIVQEQAAVTPDIALRLSRAFDTTPELWLQLQQKHDLWHAVHDSEDWKQVAKISLTTAPIQP